MTRRTRNLAWHKWWRQLVLPAVTVASAALVALWLWQHPHVWPGGPRALVQTNGQAVPSLRLTVGVWSPVSQAVAQLVDGLDAGAASAPQLDADGGGEDLTPGAIEADARARARGWPTPSEIEKRLRLERWLATVRRPSAGPVQPVSKGANQPTPELAAQHQRVLATLKNDALPPATFVDPNGPPRMDSGDPNPDRVRKADANGQYLPAAAAR